MTSPAGPPDGDVAGGDPPQKDPSELGEAIRTGRVPIVPGSLVELVMRSRISSGDDEAGDPAPDTARAPADPPSDGTPPTGPDDTPSEPESETDDTAGLGDLGSDPLGVGPVADGTQSPAAGTGDTPSSGMPVADATPPTAPGDVVPPPIAPTPTPVPDPETGPRGATPWPAEELGGNGSQPRSPFGGARPRPDGPQTDVLPGMAFGRVPGRYPSADPVTSTGRTTMPGRRRPETTGGALPPRPPRPTMPGPVTSRPAAAGVEAPLSAPPPAHAPGTSNGTNGTRPPDDVSATATTGVMPPVTDDTPAPDYGADTRSWSPWHDGDGPDARGVTGTNGVRPGPRGPSPDLVETRIVPPIPGLDRPPANPGSQQPGGPATNGTGPAHDVRPAPVPHAQPEDRDPVDDERADVGEDADAGPAVVEERTAAEPDAAAPPPGTDAAPAATGTAAATGAVAATGTAGATGATAKKSTPPREAIMSITPRRGRGVSLGGLAIGLAAILLAALTIWAIVAPSTPDPAGQGAGAVPLSPAAQELRPVAGTAAAGSRPDPSVRATVPVAQRPEDVAVSPGGKFAYLAVQDPPRLVVLDATTDAVATEIPLPGPPRFVSMAPDGARAFVSMSDDGAAVNLLGVVDVVGNRLLTTMPVEPAPGTAVPSRDGRFVYVASRGSNQLDEIDPSAGVQTRSVPVSRSPVAVVPSADGDRLYVANRGSGQMTVVDPDTLGVLGTYPVSGDAQAVAASPTAQQVAVAGPDTDRVSILDPTDGREIDSVRVDGAPTALAFAADGRHLYVAAGDVLRVVDTQSWDEVGRVPVGAAPSSIAVSPDGRTAWVTNTGAGSVSVLNLA